jgi:hypothetical protein
MRGIIPVHRNHAEHAEFAEAGTRGLGALCGHCGLCVIARDGPAMPAGQVSPPRSSRGAAAIQSAPCHVARPPWIASLRSQ